MNPLPPTGDQLQYRLDENEAKVLRVLLERFPFSRPQPAKFSSDRHCAETLDRETLLNQSLTAHRADLKRLAEKIARENLNRNADGWLLSIDTGTKESLLQILNDIRIGLWRDLGEPEDLHEPPQDSPQKLQHWNIMHLATHFVAGLIEAEN